jgi:hypothetical protein
MNAEAPMNARAELADRLWDASADGLVRARKIFSGATHAADAATAAYEELFSATWKGSRAVHQKLLMNAAINTEATLEAAEALARCRDLSQAAAVQAEHGRDLVSRTFEQLQEMNELTAEITVHVVEAAMAAASKWTIPETLIRELDV